MGYFLKNLTDRWRCDSFKVVYYTDFWIVCKGCFLSFLMNKNYRIIKIDNRFLEFYPQWQDHRPVNNKWILFWYIQDIQLCKSFKTEREAHQFALNNFK